MGELTGVCSSSEWAMMLSCQDRMAI